MASVYLAVQENFQRQVALKIMSVHLEEDPAFGKRFLREARIAVQLQHPNIVPVYDVGQHKSQHYMAMEYLPAGDLSQRLKSGLTLIDGVNIVQALAQALDYASQRAFVHRDVKPENILFRADGTPVICDFGIAKSIASETNMTLTGSVIGTPNYMSPEQAESAVVDGRSDIYSLGIILFELLTGKVPFRGDSAVSVAVKHITEPVPELPDEQRVFQPVVDKVLAKHSEERYQTGSEFAFALEQVKLKLSHRVSTTIIYGTEEIRRFSQRSGANRQRSTASEGPTPVQTQSRKWVGVGAVVIGLGVLAGVWLLDNRGSEFGNVAQISSLQEKASISPQAEALFTRAREAMDAGRFFPPEPGNALSFYDQLMLEHPDAVVAADVAGVYDAAFQQIEAQLAQNQYAKAIAQLNNVSEHMFRAEVLPAHFGRFQSLRKQAQQMEAQIRSWLVEAQQYLKLQQWVEPAGTNAFERALQVLTLDAANGDAQRMLQQILEALHQEASIAIEAKQVEDAWKHLSAARRVATNIPVSPERDARLVQLDTLEGDLKAQLLAQNDAQVKAENDAVIARNKQVLALLSEIDDLMRSGKLAYLDKAALKLDEVLQLDPQNKIARNRIANLSERYLDVAESFINAGQVEQADTAIKKAKNTPYNTDRLKALENGLADAKQAQERAEEQARLLAQKRQKITATLNQASEVWRQNQTDILPITPSKKLNQLYMQVLASDKDNADAKAGRLQLAHRLLSSASVLIQRSEHSVAEEYLAYVENLPHSDQERQRVRAELKSAQQRSKQVSELQARLQEAGEHLSAGRLTVPPEDNASELYQDILQKYPSNQEARQGLNRVAERLVGLARQQVKEGRVEEAGDLLLKARQLAGESPDWASVKLLVTGEQQWRRIKDTGNKALIEAFLQQFPQHTRRPEAEALVSAMSEEIPPDPPAVEPEPVLRKYQAGEIINHSVAGVSAPPMVVLPMRDGKQIAAGRGEVTFAEYDAYAKEAGIPRPDDEWGRDDQPVINISWQEANDYADWLTTGTGAVYRLPSKEEWAYFAGAGSQTAYFWGDSAPVCRQVPISDIVKARRNPDFRTPNRSDLLGCLRSMIIKIYANCSECYSWGTVGTTYPSKNFRANAFGLHSAVGNVAEWGQARETFGGHWDSPIEALKINYPVPIAETERSSRIGFRLVLELNTSPAPTLSTELSPHP